MRSIVLLALSLIGCIFALVTCKSPYPCSSWTTQSSCLSYADPASGETCVWENIMCQAPVNAVACTTYVTQATCQAALDPVSALNCSWTGTVCVLPAFCSHGSCNSLTTQETCALPTINGATACKWTTQPYSTSLCIPTVGSACLGFTTQAACTANSNFCDWNP